MLIHNVKNLKLLTIAYFNMTTFYNFFLKLSSHASIAQFCNVFAEQKIEHKAEFCTANMMTFDV